ncbi:MAG TPA: NAD(P)/FAD-dependent oxidoreductase [Gemmataceae bacterium]|nr:NAD(P)/FAD-dependent oxidoreductase [Gemmataceae bacterium]
MIPSTLNLEEAAWRLWDVLVVGAGPAGSLAAREIARRGLKVLLVDKASFPRWKVCGCCLNGRTQEILNDVGLKDLPSLHRGIPLHRLVLASGQRLAKIGIQSGVALSREALDSSLVEAALEKGTAFLPQTRASLGRAAAETQGVVLQNGDRSGEARARLVLVADGLGGRFFQGTTPPHTTIEKKSWIGAGVVAPIAADFYSFHTIFMACGSYGYVGLVRLEDGRLNIAASFDPAFLKRCHHPGKAAEVILQETLFPPPPGLGDLEWRGTPPLTRRLTPPAMHRVFVLGDAAGYIQPFTGEGISWALAAGQAVTELALRAARQWRPSLEKEWSDLYLRTVADRQLLCRSLAMVLRHRTWANVMITVLSRFPKMANPFLRRLNLSSPPSEGLL